MRNALFLDRKWFFFAFKMQIKICVVASLVIVHRHIVCLIYAALHLVAKLEILILELWRAFPHKNILNISHDKLLFSQKSTLYCYYWSGQLTNSSLFHTWTISGPLDQVNIRYCLFTNATNMRRFSMYVFTHVGKTLGD